MTPLRAIPLFALLAAAAVEPRGCSPERTAPSGIALTKPELAQRASEPGPAGSGCRVVPFQMDALYRAGVDDGMRSARVCCAAADQITIEASDPSLRIMVSEHGPLRRYMARFCLDPAHGSDAVSSAPTGELCAGTRCATLDVR